MGAFWSLPQRDQEQYPPDLLKCLEKDSKCKIYGKLAYNALLPLTMVPPQVAETPEDIDDVEDCMDEVDADEHADGDEENDDMGGYDEGSPMLDRSDSDESAYNAPSPEMLETFSPDK